VTRQVRRVAIAMLMLFGALFVNLNVIQVLRADTLTSDNRNARQLIREYQIRRGSLIAADGSTQLARVEETEGRLRYLRRYDGGELFAPITGFYSFVYGRAELEESFNEFLVGSAPEVFARNLADLLAGRERSGDDVILSVSPAVQQAARDALGDRRGAVVALRPATGELLAVWSSPSYDPNELSGHDGTAVREYWSQLNEDPTSPLRNRAVREWYPPGSVFKLVTAAAALEIGVPVDRTFPDPVSQELPQTTARIGNFGGGTCNNGSPLTLFQAMTVSCNTTFALLGLELGPARLVEQAEAFGLNREVGLQLPRPLVSRIPKELDPPQTAQSAIGQRDVRVTPLQMAMIAAAIGNDGVLMTPRLVTQVENERREIVRQYPPEPLVLTGRSDARAVSPATAAALRDMMVNVVAQGTGRRAAIDGVTVAGKTGTAENPVGPPTVWFVGFAPADAPQVAVAVVVEDGGDVGDEATGGAVAAPIARAVMQAALAGG
jgi:penicillin-binding protein A